MNSFFAYYLNQKHYNKPIKKDDKKKKDKKNKKKKVYFFGLGRFSS